MCKNNSEHHCIRLSNTRQYFEIRIRLIEMSRNCEISSQRYMRENLNYHHSVNIVDFEKNRQMLYTDCELIYLNARESLLRTKEKDITAREMTLIVLI